MRERKEPDGGQRPVTYCLVPYDLAAKLHESLRRHFADDPSVAVVVERRGLDRRRGEERRAAERAVPEDRRRIHAEAGRRAGERRAALVPVEPPGLPRRARAYADRLVFTERLEPSREHSEDLDTARLVGRIQAGEQERFSDLYVRYFDRVYNYLRLAVRDTHEAEDLTQQVFANVLEALPRYERRSAPFRAWLFRIVRNHALMHLRKDGRLDLADPADMSRRYEDAAPESRELDALDWISDADLLMFIERLPLVQRQVLALRYMLDLTSAEVAQVLNLKPDHVRVLQSRAIQFLNARLTALGRGPRRRGDRARLRGMERQALVLRHRRYSLV